MTLLAIVQAVADEIGLPRPATVMSSTDPTVRQLLALANREGKLLALRYPWQALTKEASFTTAAQESQGALADIAPDFGRFRNDTMCDRARVWSILGPLSAQEWQQSKGAAGAARDRFRIRGGEILFTPTPAAGRTVYFEYLSRAWCRDVDGSPDRDAWAADDDTGILDEDLMALGVKWRFLKAKGLDYAEEFRDYECRLYDARASDGGKAKLDIAADDAIRFGLAVPDGSWNL